MHFNENGQNVQAITKDGKPRYSITFPKQNKGDFTVKKIKTNNSFSKYTQTLCFNLQCSFQEIAKVSKTGGHFQKLRVDKGPRVSKLEGHF
jgi:hypothetical protein